MPRTRRIPNPPPPPLEGRPRCCYCNKHLRPRIEPATEDGKKLGQAAYLTTSWNTHGGWFGAYQGYPLREALFCNLQCSLQFATYMVRQLRSGTVKYTKHPEAK